MIDLTIVLILKQRNTKEKNKKLNKEKCQKHEIKIQITCNRKTLMRGK